MHMRAVTWMPVLLTCILYGFLVFEVLARHNSICARIRLTHVLIYDSIKLNFIHNFTYIFIHWMFLCYNFMNLCIRNVKPR